MIIEDLFSLIESLPVKGKLILIENVPTSNFLSEGSYIECMRNHTNAKCPEKFANVEGELFYFNQMLESFAEKHRDKVLFIDPYDVLCKDSECIVREGDKLFYSDHTHLSHWGAALVANSAISKLK
ncbi:MAG: hypothetical protein CL866_06450 [Cycloclasticus sp.]|nr:hypothetical protein [Cycloclasticus sp.]MBG96495.1 hypothetical protein [Cycloclasticus sp.]